MQFVKVKIEEVSVKDSKTGFKSIYKPIYEGLDNFIKEAFKPETEITARDESGNLQYYKVATVNKSITDAKNPIDSIGANIRAYFKRSREIQPAIKFAVQYVKGDTSKIDILARKMESTEPETETEETTETPETETETTDTPL